jgi:hypothetical protein
MRQRLRSRDYVALLDSFFPLLLSGVPQLNFDARWAYEQPRSKQARSSDREPLTQITGIIHRERETP